jgi:hypothetical protein
MNFTDEDLCRYLRYLMIIYYVFLCSSLLVAALVTDDLEIRGYAIFALALHIMLCFGVYALRDKR